MKTLLSILFLTGFIILSPAQQSDRPNIILIFVDDLGYGDLGCYGNERIKTPHLDRLAKEGQRWTSFYSSGATCVPSRRGLMTGRHPSALGRSPEALVPSRESFLPAMFQGQGYRTALIGKWHLAGYPDDFNSHPMHPLECGFDYFYGPLGATTPLDRPSRLLRNLTKQLPTHGSSR
ncbi:MAG: sulfatase-like hydrolase/transferase [Verrucomicrobiota bacterium]